MTASILILGSSGQVGRHLTQLMPFATAWNRSDLDLSQLADIEPAIRAAAPNWVINASAYTKVDAAEEEVALAYQINSSSVAELAAACQAIGAGLVHYSTDYVFDGTKNTPYTTTDRTRPKSVYGRSKLLGEQAIMASMDRYWILRTSWVFSEYAPNFVKTMLRLARERTEIGVVNDQWGKPTYAGELARVAAELVQDQRLIEPGIHNVACPEAVTWHGFAEAIFATAAERLPGFEVPLLNPIPTSSYPTPAQRPANSVLAVKAIEGIRPWRDFLARCVD